MRYRREIDGLRALALLPVIFFHAGFDVFSGGFVGVDIFFVISGYLITTIILEELKQDKFTIKSFYIRRARRILPALFLVVLACFPLAWFILLPQDFVRFAKSVISVVLFSSNIFFWTERGYFGQAIDLKPLIHTWSLAVEEQYYLFFPLLVILLAKRKFLLNISVLLFFVASFALCMWMTGIHQDTAFYLLPTRLWELLVGSMVSILVFDKIESKDVYRWGYAKSALGVVGIIFILFAIFFYDKDTSFPGAAATLPVVGTALIVVFATERTIIGRLLARDCFVFIGLMSYSAYLWHQPLFSFQRYVDHELTHATVLLLIACTFVLAWFTWKFVEVPCRSLRISDKQVLTFSVLGLFIFVALGSFVYFRNGFVERYDKPDALLLSSFVDSESYVFKRFDSLHFAEFSSTNKVKRKVLIIGDSYGKDLVNAIYEGGLSDKFDLSTYQINSECGNLYLEDDFSDLIPETKLPRCRFLGWYDNEKLISLIRQADSIWLASSWSQWVAERLPTSVHNLQIDFGKQVLVFGTKNFGDVDERSLLKIPVDQRVGYTNKIDYNSYLLQRDMRERFGDYYVDVSSLLCGSEVGRCRLFSEEGKPLTFDGGHLTKAGARELGFALKDKKILDKLSK